MQHRLSDRARLENLPRRVTNRGRRVSGLRLVLKPDSPTSGNRGVSYALTDAKGYARFDDLAPGSYLLTPELDAGVPAGIIVDVTPEGAVEPTLRLKWPNTAPLLARSVSGTLRDPDYYPQQSQPQLSVSLLDSLSGRVLKETHADIKGQFAFNDPIRPGLYFLRIGDLSGKRSGGTIAVQVERDAQGDALDLDLGWTTCGLTYAQRQKYPDMIEKSLCGNVADVPGAVIPNADVWLLSNENDSQIVERSQTDGMGQFALREQRGGSYQLLIKKAGFRPFIRIVRLENVERSDSCRHPINVQLGVD
jgi:hypothetical protein